MRIIAIYVIDCDLLVYNYESNLSFVSFFNRHSVQELMNEYVLHLVTNMQASRKIFEHESYIFYSHRIDKRAAVLVTDHEYPSRVAFNILLEVFENPAQQHLKTIIRQYQDPRLIDRISSIQHQLDETLVIMHENISLVLERGENIDKLVEKSQRLSHQSKMFYKVAKQHNRCCIIS